MAIDRSTACAALALGAVAVVAGCVSRKDGAWPTQAVAVTGWDGYVETFAQVRQETFGAPGDTRESEEAFFQESLQLRFEGYTYHPNLFKLSAGGLFGLVQRDFTESYGGLERDIDHSGTIEGFDLAGTFLGRKNYPLSLYASRNTLLSPRSFRSSVLTTTERYGAEWRVSGKGVSNLMHVDSTDVELDPLDPLDVEGRNKNRSFRNEATFELTGSNTLDLAYEHRRETEDPFDIESIVDRGTIRDRQVFGDRNRHRLDSSLDLTSQDGSYGYTDVRWREWLRLGLTEDLHSDTQLGIADLTRDSSAGVPTLEEQTYELSQLFEHRLYDSLVTQLELHGREVTFDPDGQEDEVGVRFGPSYRKKTPLGLLSASYRGSFSHRTRDAGGSRLVQVIDEAAVFNDPIRVVLANRNVSPGTIFVTDATGITIYNAGVDYLVLQVGDRTELERLPTGTIPNGGAVLVDYVFDAGGDFVQDTWHHTFSFRHRFPFGLSVYYAYFQQEQGGETGGGAGPVAVFEDIVNHTVGSEYESDLLRLRAEWEDRSSNIDAYETIRLGGDVRHTFAFGGRPSLGLHWTRREQDEPIDRRTSLLAAEARYRQRITDGLDLDAGFGWREGRDTLAGDDEGVHADLFLEWRFNKFEVRLRAEMNDFDSDFTVNESWLLYLQLRRNF